MLYQLGTAIDGIIILLDFVVVGLLVYLLRQPRDAFYKWMAILGVVILALLLSGFKFLCSSPGTLASTPGLVVIKNPEKHVAKLYYLRHYPDKTWQVEWVAYLLISGKEVVLETEGQLGQQVAWQHAGKWHYAPFRLGNATQTEIIFPQDFTAVDTSGRIEAAVADYTLTKLGSWLSNLLTVASIGLWATLIGRLFSSKSRLATAARLSS